jgi:hypothetical protein
MTPEQMSSLLDSNDIIRFYGQLIGTPGLSDENNALVNSYLGKLLGVQENSINALVDKIRANSSGLITK